MNELWKDEAELHHMPRPIKDGGTLHTQGRTSIPSETMMHFPPVSDSPPISEKFSDFLRNFYNVTFKFLDFHPPKFLMTFFLVIHHKFRIPPYFRCSSTFPPCFVNIFLSPLLFL